METEFEKYVRLEKELLKLIEDDACLDSISLRQDLEKVFEEHKQASIFRLHGKFTEMEKREQIPEDLKTNFLTAVYELKKFRLVDFFCKDTEINNENGEE